MTDKIYLRAFEYSDLTLLNAIRNDDTLFQTTTGNKYYISSEYDKKWIEDKIFNNYDQLYLVICDSESHKPIGYVSINNIDYVNRKAEYGGLIISKEFSSKGVGTAAGNLMLNHLFHELGMNMVYCFIKEGNIGTIKISEKFGFQKDGLIRQYVYKQNQFHNVYIYSLLKADYENSIKDI